MGFLLHILAALGVESLGEADLTSGWRAPWMLVVLACVPIVLAARASSDLLAGRFERAGWLARLVSLSGPLLYAVFVVGCGWIDSVRAWTGDELDLFGWPAPALFLALAPFVLLQLLAIDAHARIGEGRRDAWRAMRRFQVRMFLSALLPLVFYLVVASLIGRSEVARVLIERVSLFGAAFLLGMVLLLAAFLPRLLTSAWETSSLAAGNLREVFDEVARRARFRARDVLVWRTGNLMANAAIVGLLPHTRVVLFSDSLLALLTPRQLASVYAHEIGHAARHHVAVFVAWAVGFFLFADLASAWFGLENEWLLGFGGVAMLGVWYHGFGWLSRRFECDADLYSFRLLGDLEGLASALERVAGRLRDVASWRHFSTSERVRFLQRAVADPGFASRFQRHVRRLAAAGFLLAGAGLVLQGRELLRVYPEQRVLADLALARYGRALERARADGDLDPGALELAQLGVDLTRAGGGTAPDPDELVRLARAALERGDARLAAAQLELSILRGREDLTPVVIALQALGDGDAEQLEAALEALDEDWRAGIEELND